MPTLVIVGAQWGDEAKGKLVDVLGSEADMVVRYAGGNNAGHTVMTGGMTFKFQLIPAALLHPRTVAVLGGGMVVDPKGFLDELDRTKALKADLADLKVSAAAHVVFPYHRMLDKLQEEARGENKIGTTSRGIGPAYEDKVGRVGIRMSEFVRPERFAKRLREVLAVKNRLLQLFGEQPLSFDDLFDEYGCYAERIAPMVCDTEVLVQDAVYGGKRVLFEGAQGTFLDLDSGTYPYVTSSHPVAGGACLGTGIGPRAIDSVIGVCKAYTTRVGSGPFPTELLDETGDWIRETGQEYGTVTGRNRRCGWLDLVVLRHSCRLNSLSALALTRLDILAGLGTIKAATSYKLDGHEIRYVPADISDFARVTPSLVELPGWEGDLSAIRRFDDLPASARSYVQFVEEQTGTPVAMIGVGPDREQTIVVRPELIWIA
ncbi:MAG: adenylosuccinate synthase [Fimbriimonadales bacterium]